MHHTKLISILSYENLKWISWTSVLSNLLQVHARYLQQIIRLSPKGGNKQGGDIAVASNTQLNRPFLCMSSKVNLTKFLLTFSKSSHYLILWWYCIPSNRKRPGFNSNQVSTSNKNHSITQSLVHLSVYRNSLGFLSHSLSDALLWWRSDEKL